MAVSKAFARMVISADANIDSIRKYPKKDVPKEFYDLVEAFYYSILQPGMEMTNNECIPNIGSIKKFKRRV